MRRSGDVKAGICGAVGGAFLCGFMAFLFQFAGGCLLGIPLFCLIWHPVHGVVTEYRAERIAMGFSQMQYTRTWVHLRRTDTNRTCTIHGYDMQDAGTADAFTRRAYPLGSTHAVLGAYDDFCSDWTIFTIIGGLGTAFCMANAALCTVVAVLGICDVACSAFSSSKQTPSARGNVALTDLMPTATIDNTPI